MKKAAIVIMIFALGISLSMGIDDVQKRCESSLDKLEQALTDHNFGLVESLFHEDFDYAGLGCGGHCTSSKMVASMIISSYPHRVNGIEIKDVESEGPDYRVKTRFSYFDAQANADAEAEFGVLMTGAGEFLGMELPGIKLVLPGQESSADCSGGSCGSEGEGKQ